MARLGRGARDQGELWDLTAGYRRERLGHRCVRLDPACAAGSAAGYNPLLVIPREPEEVKYAQSVTDVLLDPKGRDPPRTLLEQSAHALLVGCILPVLYAERERSLAWLRAPARRPAAPVREALNAMLHPTTTRNSRWAGAMCAAAGRRRFARWCRRRRAPSSTSTRAPRPGVNAHPESRLELLRAPILAVNTAASDFAAEELVGGERRVALYITVATAELDRLRGLLRIVLNQLCRR